MPAWIMRYPRGRNTPPAQEATAAGRKPLLREVPTVAEGYVFGGTRMNTGIRTDAPPAETSTA
jgi:hypothetical protein